MSLKRHAAIVWAAAATLLALGSGPGHAHHSVYGDFDVKRLVEIKGTFAGADMINPHSWFKLQEVDSNGKPKLGKDGKPVIWAFETPGPAALMRMGITPKLFKTPGVFTIYAPPALDGSAKGLFLLTIFPDGRRLFIGNPKDPIFLPLADKINAVAEVKK